MRKPRPIVYSLEEVIITRDATSAHIKYKDPEFGETTLTMGPKVQSDTLRGEAEHARNFKYVAIEPPLGSPQIIFHPSSGQWTPRGDVLRCLIMDQIDDVREPVITIDNKELTLSEFGTMLCTYAGWGMRIEFTPEDAVHRRPRLEVREPKK